MIDSQSPSRTITAPEEILALVRFLASDAGVCITGQEIGVAGGR